MIHCILNNCPQCMVAGDIDGLVHLCSVWRGCKVIVLPSTREISMIRLSYCYKTNVRVYMVRTPYRQAYDRQHHDALIHKSKMGLRRSPSIAQVNRRGKIIKKKHK
ncbi:hypothetical protein BDW22DRAFT_753524 [Trametopsis cervina]|nr:hypothetical protein BDW22DRAFT_753524 [Trametopsis cervina]